MIEDPRARQSYLGITLAVLAILVIGIGTYTWVTLQQHREARACTAAGGHVLTRLAGRPGFARLCLSADGRVIEP
jgi:hypothetical protein